MLVIFPFEEAIYEQAGVPVEFVGHPLMDLAALDGPPDAFLRRVGLNPQAKTIAVLPGSRPNEVRRILAGPASTACRPHSRGACRAFSSSSPGRRTSTMALFVALRRHAELTVAVVEGETDAVLAAADVALTASGTATVQTALHDTPMVVVYRLSPLTYQLGRRLRDSVDTFGMVNLIAGERIVPELIQDAFTPEAVADEAVSMLTDTRAGSACGPDWPRVRQMLGGPGASRRAAEAIVAT